MSQGKFIRGKYSTDAGVVHPIRIQPETVIAQTNPAPAGEITGLVTARVGGSRRQYGILARTVRLAWTGAAPDGYDPNGIITLPILTLAAYTALAPGQAVTYQGTAAQVIGKSPERIR